MKKISLNLIIEKDKAAVRTELKRYRMFLNWGLTNSFTNKKKAAIFESRFNAWINETFYELNNIYAKVMYVSRLAWLVVDRETENKIARAFPIIDTQFNKLYRADFRGADGSYYAFNSIEEISRQLIYCINLLITFRRDKKDWEQIKELEMLIRQLNRISTEIKETADPGELGSQTKRRE